MELGDSQAAMREENFQQKQERLDQVTLAWIQVCGCQRCSTSTGTKHSFHRMIQLTVVVWPPPSYLTRSGLLCHEAYRITLLQADRCPPPTVHRSMR